MAVALNVKGEAAAGSTPASPRSVAVTVVANANRVAVGVLFASHPLGTTAATFAGNAMTSLGTVSDASGRVVQMYALKGDANIPTGSQTFSVTYTGTPSVAGVGVWVFDGADQTTGWQNFATAGPTTDTAATITITSANGNMACAAEIDDNASGRTINGGTSDWEETAFDGNYLGSHRASVSGSTQLGWTLGSSVSWAMAGVDVIAATAAGSSSVSPSVSRSASPSSSLSASPSSTPSASISPSPAGIIVMERTVFDYVD